MRISGLRRSLNTAIAQCRRVPLQIMIIINSISETRATNAAYNPLECYVPCDISGPLSPGWLQRLHSMCCRLLMLLLAAACAFSSLRINIISCIEMRTETESTSRRRASRAEGRAPTRRTRHKCGAHRPVRLVRTPKSAQAPPPPRRAGWHSHAKNPTVRRKRTRTRFSFIFIRTIDSLGNCLIGNMIRLIRIICVSTRCVWVCVCACVCVRISEVDIFSGALLGGG